MPNLLGAAKEPSIGVCTILPSYKYIKYAKEMQNRESFWKESRVAQLFRFIFGEIPAHYEASKHGPKMSLNQAASAIGVTPEMLIVGFTKLKLKHSQTTLKEIIIFNDIIV